MINRDTLVFNFFGRTSQWSVRCLSEIKFYGNECGANFFE